ncbi:MAG: hypothetical protein ACLQAT_22875 [Candidatus Binataceae bacterium]
MGFFIPIGIVAQVFLSGLREFDHGRHVARNELRNPEILAGENRCDVFSRLLITESLDRRTNKRRSLTAIPSAS